MLGDRARLVALDRADEVPLERQRSELRDFFHTFLRVALTEGALSCGICLKNALGREGLGDRDERDLISAPVSALRGTLDSCANCLQVGSDCGHNLPRAAKPCLKNKISVLTQVPKA